MDKEIEISLKNIDRNIEDIKKKLTELYESRNKQNGDIIRMQKDIEDLNDDLNGFGKKVEKHITSSDSFRDEVKAIKLKLNIVQWVGSIVGGAVMLYIINNILGLIK